MAEIKAITNKRSINEVKNSQQGAPFNIIPGSSKRANGTATFFFHCGAKTGYVSEKAEPFVVTSKQADKVVIADIEYADGSVFKDCLMPVGIDDSKAVQTF